MVKTFRKLLIRIGKVIPFVLAFIVAFGYFENIYAILTGNVVENYDGELYYHTPISAFIGDIIYIDWFDVFLLYVLAVALEFCKYNLKCVHFLLLNLFVRFALEHYYIDSNMVVGIATLMALYGLYCACGGIKMLISTPK